MWKNKRRAWMGGGFAALLIIPRAFLFYSERAPDVSSQLLVEARCGVAAGGKLSGDRVRVTCGMSTAEIETAISQAVAEFDLQTLIDQTQKNQIKDLKAVEALAEKLGLTPEAAINILKMLKTPKSATVPVAKRFAVLTAPYINVAVKMQALPAAASTVPSQPPPPGIPPGTRSPATDVERGDPGRNQTCHSRVCCSGW